MIVLSATCDYNGELNVTIYITPDNDTSPFAIYDLPFGQSTILRSTVAMSLYDITTPLVLSFALCTWYLILSMKVKGDRIHNSQHHPSCGLKNA